MNEYMNSLVPTVIERSGNGEEPMTSTLAF